MRVIVVLLLMIFGLKVTGQCNYTIVPSYTPASCPSCCDGSATFSLNGTGPLCGPFGSTLEPVGVSTFGIWSNLCAGSYTIIFRDGGCCGVYICSFFLNFTSTDINNKEDYSKGVYLFPNPVSNNLNIETEQYFEPGTEIEITNLFGQLVLKLNYIKEIDVSSLANGVYTIRLISKNKTTQRRLVISK